jgi:NADH dehydrogenase
MMAGVRRPRVVVVGGGFAGLAAAQALPRSLDVTVIDPGEWFEFLPNVHELVSGVKRPEELRLDRTAIVERAGHHHRRLRVERIDPATRRVHLAGTDTIDYDALIIAAGSESGTFGVPGVLEHGLMFRDVARCDRIGRRLRELASTDEPWRVVIVGGGIEGVEALGECLRRYRSDPDMHVTLVEARERVLPDAPPTVDATIRRLAAPHAVEIRTGVRVAAVERTAVALADGARLPSDATIWTGGPVPVPVLVRSGLAPSNRDWVDVDETLQHRVHGAVFVAGDASGFPNGLAKQAYHARDMGAHAAANVVRYLRGTPLEVFRPSTKPILVAFGDLTTLLLAEDVVVAAPALAAGKEAVFELVMAQIDGVDRLEALVRVGTRLGGAAQNLLWPIVSSPASLLAQASLQVLAFHRCPTSAPAKHTSAKASSMPISGHTSPIPCPRSMTSW